MQYYYTSRFLHLLLITFVLYQAYEAGNGIVVEDSLRRKFQLSKSQHLPIYIGSGTIITDEYIITNAFFFITTELRIEGIL